MAKKDNKKQMSRVRPRQELAGMPSQINMHPIHTRVFRFGLNPSQTSLTITRKCLLCLQGVIYQDSSMIWRTQTFIQAIRLRRISIWCTSASTNNLDSFAIEWLDPYGPSTQRTASCTQMIAGHLTSKVPQGSFADLWSQVTNTGAYNEALFMLNILPKSIVDIEVQIVYADGLQSASESIVRTSSLTLAGVGVGALDNALPSGALGTQVLGPFSDLELVYLT